ncbi:MAG: DUF4079 family protein [Myxococcota bacterium]
MLAFVHPAWMVLTLVVALRTAKLGLDIRRLRARSARVGKDLREAHLRFGRLAMILVWVGFAMGPVSMLLFRERAAFDSFHGILGVIVLGLFSWTGWTGRALSRGDQEVRGIHRLGAAASLGAALLSAVAGFTLLP